MRVVLEVDEGVIFKDLEGALLKIPGVWGVKQE